MRQLLGSVAVAVRGRVTHPTTVSFDELQARDVH